ncbi:MAG: iron-containing alcohol dehydrogenase [Candidatus Methylumidiphilus sp.]
MRLLPMPEISIGAGTLAETCGILDRWQADKVLLVTDPGLIQVGIAGRLLTLLEAGGKTVALFDGVAPDPAIDVARQVGELARTAGIDAVIGLGGGSSLDIAKLAAALATNRKDLEDYIGVDKLERDALPFIAIPTTAGTGSEVTPIAILSDEQEQVKKGVVSARMMPRHAILDPTLTLGLKPYTTAVTGMDALTHALESYTSLHAHAYSEALSLQAMGLIAQNLPTAFRDGGNVAAREAMQLGSLLAGMAFANVGVAAAHALAYPLGGMFHITHGLATSLMLLPVLAFNLEGNEDKYRRMAQRLTGRAHASAEMVGQAVGTLLDELALPRNLAAAGVPASALPVMAEKAMAVTRLLGNNPRPVTEADALALYQSAFAR